MLMWFSCINKDTSILTSTFKCCHTAPCRRRLTHSFYFYVFSDISKCHSTTTEKEQLCCCLHCVCPSSTQTHPWQVPRGSTCSPPVNIRSLKKKTPACDLIFISVSVVIWNDHLRSALTLPGHRKPAALLSWNKLSQYQLSLQSNSRPSEWEWKHTLPLCWEHWENAKDTGHGAGSPDSGEMPPCDCISLLSKPMPQPIPFLTNSQGLNWSMLSRTAEG